MLEAPCADARNCRTSPNSFSYRVSRDESEMGPSTNVGTTKSSRTFSPAVNGLRCTVLSWLMDRATDDRYSLLR